MNVKINQGFSLSLFWIWILVMSGCQFWIYRVVIKTISTTPQLDFVSLILYLLPVELMCAYAYYSARSTLPSVCLSMEIPWYLLFDLWFNVHLLILNPWTSNSTLNQGNKHYSNIIQIAQYISAFMNVFYVFCLFGFFFVPCVYEIIFFPVHDLF